MVMTKYAAIRARVSLEEKEAFHAKLDLFNEVARSEGGTRLTESKVIRHFARCFIREGLELSPDGLKELRSTVLYLAGATRNLNQITRKLNSDGNVNPDAVLKHMDSVQKSVSHLQQTLVKLIALQQKGATDLVGLDELDSPHV
jgi:hypothetical protein